MRMKFFTCSVIVLSAMLSVACNTLDDYPFMTLDIDTAVLNLDESVYAEDVREAILQAGEEGITSFVVYGSASKLGLGTSGTNVFSGTAVKTIDLRSTEGWPIGEVIIGNKRVVGPMFPSQAFLGTDDDFQDLREVILPDEVTLIASSAFYGCEKLEGVYGENVTAIDFNAFEGCSSLFNISFPKLRILGNGAFRQTSVETVVFADLQFMDQNVFAECRSLRKVELPELAAVPVKAFANCRNLEKAVFLSAAVIEEDAFMNCKSLALLEAPQVEILKTSALCLCESLKWLDFPNAMDLKQYSFAGTPVESLSLTAPGSLEVSEYSFTDMVTEDCNLILNSDKKPGGTGLPTADPEANLWAGTVWKSISFM